TRHRARGGRTPADPPKDAWGGGQRAPGPPPPAIRKPADARQAGPTRRRDLAADRSSRPRSDERFSGTCRRSISRLAEKTWAAGRSERRASTQRRRLGDDPSFQTEKSRQVTP